MLDSESKKLWRGHTKHEKGAFGSTFTPRRDIRRGVRTHCLKGGRMCTKDFFREGKQNEISERLEGRGYVKRNR